MGLQKAQILYKVACSEGQCDIWPKAEYDAQKSENSGNEAFYHNLLPPISVTGGTV